MTEHPITPPPELVQKWFDESPYRDGCEHVATQAARWGADQELDACCDWIYKLFQRGLEWSKDLRAARRPKPPSLKQRALEALEDHEIEWLKRSSIIRRALEQLDD